MNNIKIKQHKNKKYFVAELNGLSAFGINELEAEQNLLKLINRVGIKSK